MKTQKTPKTKAPVAAQKRPLKKMRELTSKEIQKVLGGTTVPRHGSCGY